MIPGKRPAKPTSFRRMLLRHKVSLPFALPRGRVKDINILKILVDSFGERLQILHPFRFATAYRNLENEKSRWAQEKAMTHFMLATVIESHTFNPIQRSKALRLADSLVKQLEKGGGENWRPKDFTPDELSLIIEIGQNNFSELYKTVDKLSVAMKFNLGPVNPKEHTISWCFRYVGLFLDYAKRVSSPNRATT